MPPAPGAPLHAGSSSQLLFGLPGCVQIVADIFQPSPGVEGMVGRLSSWRISCGWWRFGLGAVFGAAIVSDMFETSVPYSPPMLQHHC